MTVPEVSVVVASHRRPERLGRLLDALAEQTVGTFETIVVHDDGPGETEALLHDHPLPGLRHIAFAPGEGTAARMRNRGWRAASAPLVAFTDDDCRPAPAWLERALAIARAHPGAIVQGATRPDPSEWDRFDRHLFLHTVVVDPPTRFAETCNIVYPRSVLEAIGGFDERFLLPVGEDADLALRARRSGAGLAPAPDALVHHAIEPMSVIERIRASPRYGQLAVVAARNPEYRREPGHPLGLFAKDTHACIVPAIVGLAAAPRRPALVLLALPWIAVKAHQFRGYAGRGRWLRRLGAHFVIDAADVLAFARESVRQRSLFL